MDTDTHDDLDDFDALEGPTDAELRDIEDALPGGDDTALARLREAVTERDARDRVNLERYRAALLASDHALTADLLAGESFEEVEASYEAARQLAERVRAATAESVPPGAPGRSAAPPASSFDKIRKGLATLP